MAKTVQIAVDPAHPGTPSLTPPYHGGLYRLLDDGRVYFQPCGWKHLNQPEWSLVSDPIADEPQTTERDRAAQVLLNKLFLHDECAIGIGELLSAVRAFAESEQARLDAKGGR